MLDKRQFYIDGQWVAPAAGTDCDVINPSTEEAFAVISLGGAADTDAAVAAATKRAFPDMGCDRADGPAWLVVEKHLSTSTRRVWTTWPKTISRRDGGADRYGEARSRPLTGLGHIKNFIRAAKGFEFERPFGRARAE